ncbi:MAG: hypothetical protein ACE5Q3_04545 [Alphaproteobacteria bacterium]
MITALGRTWPIREFGRGEWLLLLLLGYATWGGTEMPEGPWRHLPSAVFIAVSAVAIGRERRRAPRLLAKTWPLPLAVALLLLAAPGSPYPALALVQGADVAALAFAGLAIALTSRGPVPLFHALVLFTGAVLAADLVILATTYPPGGTPARGHGLHADQAAAGQFALAAYLAWLLAAVAADRLAGRVFFAVGALGAFVFLLSTGSTPSVLAALASPVILFLLFAVGQLADHSRYVALAGFFAAAAASTYVMWAIGLSMERLLTSATGNAPVADRLGLIDYLSGAAHPLSGFPSFWYSGLELNASALSTGHITIGDRPVTGYLDLALRASLGGLALTLLALGHGIVRVVGLGRQADLERQELASYGFAVVMLLAIAVLNSMESTLLRPPGFLSALFVLTYSSAGSWRPRDGSRERSPSSRVGVRAASVTDALAKAVPTYHSPLPSAAPLDMPRAPEARARHVSPASAAPETRTDGYDAEIESQWDALRALCEQAARVPWHDNGSLDHLFLALDELCLEARTVGYTPVTRAARLLHGYLEHVEDAGSADIAVVGAHIRALDFLIGRRVKCCGKRENRLIEALATLGRQQGSGPSGSAHTVGAGGSADSGYDRNLLAFRRRLDQIYAHPNGNGSHGSGDLEALGELLEDIQHQARTVGYTAVARAARRLRSYLSSVPSETADSTVIDLELRALTETIDRRTRRSHADP